MIYANADQGLSGVLYEIRQVVNLVRIKMEPLAGLASCLKGKTTVPLGNTQVLADEQGELCGPHPCAEQRKTS